jgi:hypothetical protein
VLVKSQWVKYSHGGTALHALPGTRNASLVALEAVRTGWTDTYMRIQGVCDAVYLWDPVYDCAQ